MSWRFAILLLPALLCGCLRPQVKDKPVRRVELSGADKAPWCRGCPPKMIFFADKDRKRLVQAFNGMRGPEGDEKIHLAFYGPKNRLIEDIRFDTDLEESVGEEAARLIYDVVAENRISKFEKR